MAEMQVSPQDLARVRARLIRGHHRLSAQQRKRLNAISGVHVKEIPADGFTVVDGRIKTDPEAKRTQGAPTERPSDPPDRSAPAT